MGPSSVTHSRWLNYYLDIRKKNLWVPSGHQIFLSSFPSFFLLAFFLSNKYIHEPYDLVPVSRFKLLVTKSQTVDEDVLARYFQLAFLLSLCTLWGLQAGAALG